MIRILLIPSIVQGLQKFKDTSKVRPNLFRAGFILKIAALEVEHKSDRYIKSNTSVT